jgi:hypothetical protein
MSYKKWGDGERDFIQNNYTLLSDDELALRLSQMSNSPVSVAMVRRQRRKLMIKKDRGRPRKTGSVVFNDGPSTN